MVFVVVLTVYITASFAIYQIMKRVCPRAGIFRAPRSFLLFLLLSLTWGAPMSLAGALISLILLIAGKRPSRLGHCVCFELDGINWGLNLGLFMIIPKGERRGTGSHEHGHAVQNIYFGFFMPAVVALPSSLRFRVRDRRAKKGRAQKGGYDDIWFERSASMSGAAFFENRKDEI